MAIKHFCPALLAALLLTGCASKGERYLFAGSAWRGRPDTIVPANPHYELLSLRTRDGTKIAAMFGAALDAEGQPLADAASRPTVLFFYGNGSCLRNFQGVFERLRRAGANVLIPEYPGYGMSEGRATEANCYAAADAAYEYLLARPEVDRGRIIVGGYSLGGAVAIDFASRRRVAGLMTISTFTSVHDIARTAAPRSIRWMTPLFFRSRFNSLGKMHAIACPVLIVHGRDDGFVPSTMSDRLAAAATQAKCARWNVPGDHGTVLNQPDLWLGAGEWFNTAASGGTGGIHSAGK